MTLKEFAEGRGVEYNALMQWLYRRPELRERMPKEGKSYVIEPGDGIFEILDKKYPIPKPIQVIQDEEARKELAEANRKIQELQEAMLKMAARASQADAMQLMLEQRDTELEQTREALHKEQEERISIAESAGRLRVELEAAQKDASEAKEKAERMESAGLFARIFRSW